MEVTAYEGRKVLGIPQADENFKRVRFKFLVFITNVMMLVGKRPGINQ